MKSENSNKKNIIYASNDDYAYLAGISIMSLLKHNKDIKIWFFADNVSDDNLNKLKRICSDNSTDFEAVDVRLILNKLKEKGVNGYDNAIDKGLTTYARFFASDFILDGSRALYIDCDTLILGSVEELFHMDMNGKAVAMAYDCFSNKYKRFIDFPEQDSYYNAGVMLIDTGRWDELKCTDRLFYHIQNVRNDYPLCDQDLINIVLKEDIMLMNMKYNYLSQYFLYKHRYYEKIFGLKSPFFWNKEEWIDGKNNPEKIAIYHFAGNTFTRPWFENSKHPLKKIYDKYYYASPWANKKQKRFKIKPEYEIQYLCYRILPQSINAVVASIMQTIFMKIQYKL